MIILIKLLSSSIPGYEYHMKYVCRSEDDESVATFSCPHCSKVFNSEAGLKYHVKNGVCKKNISNDDNHDNNADDDNNNDNNNNDNINNPNISILRSKRISIPPVKLTVNEYGEWREKRDKVIISVDNNNYESNSDEDDDYELVDDDDLVDEEELTTKNVSNSKRNISSTGHGVHGHVKKMKTTKPNGQRDVFLTFNETLDNDEKNDKNTIKMIPQSFISSLLEGTRVKDGSLFVCSMSNWFRENSIEFPDTTVVAIDDDRNFGKIVLLPFHGISRDDTKLDYLINTGGPIYSTAFMDPSLDLSSDYECKYLLVGLGAIGYHPYDIYEVGKKYSHPSFIQLWEVDSESINQLYCIGLHRGPVWSIAWCPLKFEQSTNLIGIAAIVCGDGSCIILILPKREHSMSIEEPPCLKESDVRRWELIVSSNFIQTASWNPNKLELCCGMLDGSIQIWTFASLLLSNSNSNDKIIKVSLTPHPIMSPSPSKIYVDLSITESIGSTSAINSIKYCPFNTDIFLTAGMDGHIRIWHVDDKLHPLFTRYLKGDIKDVQWDPNGLSIIAVYTFLSFFISLKLNFIVK